MKSRKKPEQATVSSVPSLDGFSDVTSRKGDGWYQPSNGSWIVGRLLGRFQLSGKRQRAYYQVGVFQASPDAVAVSGKGQEASEKKIEPKQLINVDDRKALEDIRAYAETDGVYDIFIRWGEKKTLDNGNTFWPAEVKVKTIKPPTHRVKREAFNAPPEMSSNPYGPEDYSDEDIPF